MATTMEDVRRVYRQRVKACHPDQYGNDPVRLKEGQDELTELNLAYETLFKGDLGSVRSTSMSYSSHRFRQRTTRRQPRFASGTGWETRQVAWWFLPLMVILLVVYFYHALQPMVSAPGAIPSK